mmetsp:Transcript_21375/g.46897  ORF Transcript_21375/g.46897 Transcript_21375/m.46897 type:complete len:297 (+) Transcript_21375:1802-2692(+)
MPQQRRAGGQGVDGLAHHGNRLPGPVHGPWLQCVSDQPIRRERELGGLLRVPCRHDQGRRGRRHLHVHGGHLQQPHHRGVRDVPVRPLPALAWADQLPHVQARIHLGLPWGSGVHSMRHQFLQPRLWRVGVRSLPAPADGGFLCGVECGAVRVHRGLVPVRGDRLQRARVPALPGGGDIGARRQPGDGGATELQPHRPVPRGPAARHGHPADRQHPPGQPRRRRALRHHRRLDGAHPGGLTALRHRRGRNGCVQLRCGSLCADRAAPVGGPGAGPPVRDEPHQANHRDDALASGAQ